MKKILCATLDGTNARVVEVESSFIKALPSFSIVGLASNSIQEARDRVKAALSHIGYTFPAMKITINLSPSDLKKSGSHFDLAIALSIALQKESVSLDGYYVFGELGLDGRIKDTSLIFPLLLSLSKEPIKALVPKSALEKLSKIPNVTLYGIDSLQECIEALQSNSLQPAKPKPYPYPSLEQKYFYMEEYPVDFREVKGQELAKRAALIAAAGMHNILLEGSPGCGKSMIIKRLRYILPPMEMKEILDVAKLESFDEKEPTFKPLRPYRSPHHSGTKASIFGGGSSSARPGEVALAHRGMLFFDELPHFSKSVLEALREPLQDKRILISRVNNKVIYETTFLFAAAQNPCPCGNLLSPTKECRCSDLEIKRYRAKVSEPLLDRIEIYVQMSEIDENATTSVSSQELHEKVRRAFLFQKKRGQKEFNGKLSEREVEAFCILDEDAKAVLEQATLRFGLSQRSIGNIKKVARTIADLEESSVIRKKDILEALGFRRR